MFFIVVAPAFIPGSQLSDPAHAMVLCSGNIWSSSPSGLCRSLGEILQVRFSRTRFTLPLLYRPKRVVGSLSDFKEYRKVSLARRGHSMAYSFFV